MAVEWVFFVWFGLYFILVLILGYTKCVLLAAYMYATIQVSGYVQYTSSVCKDVSCVCHATNSNNEGVMAEIVLHLY